MAIEAAEPWQMRRPGTTESLRIEVQKMAFHQVSLHLIADTVYLEDGDR